MAIELAKAYVQIVPSAQGIKGKLESALGGEAEAAGKSAGGRITGGIKKAFGGVGKLAGLAFGAAATGIGALGKSAISAYADFEQLSGGIETLFGDSAASVLANADRAFQTAGLSANAYMETSIQSAAALISSLKGDQAAAADLMDLSITDMADNVNKMGTSMEAVQNAYRGFSRGNFTMLDNLALGYAGTKEGMEKLLADAQKISGVKYDIGNYADMVNAIHVVQTEMGITGTTALEASETISGSLSSVKAAWKNLLTGMVNGDADQSTLVQNLVSSAKSLGRNIIPALKTALRGAGEVVKELAPVIAEELPGLVQDVLPDLVSAAISLAITLGSALAQNAPAIIQTLVQALVENAPAILEGGWELTKSLASGLIQAAPSLIAAAGELLWTIFVEIGKGVVDLFSAGWDLVEGLWDGISNAKDWLWEQISGWLGGLWDGILGFFGIASPSKKMAWAGGMLPEGLAVGINAGADEAVSAAARMNADIMAAMGGGGELSMQATGGAVVEYRHSGTIRVEGVNSEGELVAVANIVYERLVARLRNEARYA